MTTQSDYKHRATFVFKGVTWKYDKAYGEWTPVGKKYKHLPTVWSTSRIPGHSGWRVDTEIASTPLKALKQWYKGSVASSTAHYKRLNNAVKFQAALLKKYKAKSWA